MLKRRRHGSRSERYAPRWPSVAGWLIGLLAGLAALVGVAYLYGHTAGGDVPLLDALHETFQKPVVASTVAFGCASIVALCIRHLMLELLAWWPGRVIVEEFATGPEVGDADAARLTAAFRDRLARSHLQSPALMPATAQQGDFTDVLTSSGIDPTNIFASVVALVRAAKPTHAYEVRGALNRREGPKPCGITIHVVRQPGKASPGLTVWESDWERAIARAADHATAAILPRTRRCRSPWSSWRGYHLPSSLMHQYERAAQYEHDRRFDESLDLYYRAARDDPMNLGLRVQIGFLQEKLALFLDALDTYEAILAVAQPGRPGRSGRDAGEDRLSRFYNRRARRDRKRALLVARYRRAVLLGGADLPAQWCRVPAPEPTHRDAQRAALRRRLRPELIGLLERARTSAEVAKLTNGINTERPSVPEDDRKPAVQLLADPDPEAKVVCVPHQELEEAMVLASMYELVALRSQVPPWQLRRLGVITRPVVNLALLCLRQRLTRVLGGDLRHEEIKERVDEIERRRRFTRWQEHYNAACAYSLPLLPGNPAELPKKERRRLVEAAVDRLERGIECTDSGFVASRRDWLLSDDPDLDGLRAHDRFKQFEARFFPSALRTRERPQGLHTWELSSYTLELLSATAERYEQVWQARKHALTADTEIRELVAWCELEASAWERTRDVARHHRHWRTRMKLIRHAREASEGLAPLEVRFPCFAEMDSSPTDANVTDVASWVRGNDERLECLARTIDVVGAGDGGCPLVQDLAGRRVELGRIDVAGSKLRRAHLAQLCEAHAALWLTFRKSVSGELAPGTFERGVGDLLGLWREVMGRYPTAPQAVAGRRRGGRERGRRPGTALPR